MNQRLLLSLTLAMTLTAVSCGAGKKQEGTATGVPKQIKEAAGAFSPDSAYAYVAAQVDFGPRVPGLAAHDECARWIENRLRATGPDSLLVQNGSVRAYDGTRLPISNIFASYNRTNPRRILLVAHWDTRPWADNDPDTENHIRPIPGANDGASGVGVLLEVARNMALKKPSVGVDILMVDAEDYGRSGGFSDDGDSWCLGTQYFLDNLPYPDGQLPAFAVVLDMVGGRDAHFSKEWTSYELARPYTDMIWNEAADMGLGTRFRDRVTSGVIDDHTFLNQAGIPAVDIVECDNDITNGFPPYWHTMDDDMDNIDRTTLGDVGKVVLNIIYTAKI